MQTKTLKSVKKLRVLLDCDFSVLVLRQVIRMSVFNFIYLPAKYCGGNRAVTLKPNILQLCGIFIIAHQRGFEKVMFSVVRMCLSLFKGSL